MDREPLHGYPPFFRFFSTMRRGNVLTLAKARPMLAALALAAACGPEAGSGADNWEFQADTARQTSWLRAVGREGPRDGARTKEVILSFDCLPGQRSSTIMTEQALRQGSTDARLQVDASRPRRIPGFAGTTSSSGQVVLTIPQDSILTLLRGHQRATIEYADGAGSSHTIAEFPLEGLEKYREPFLASCAD
jgi:hypothetical protein